MVIWALITMLWSPFSVSVPNFHKMSAVQSLTGLKLVLQLALYGAVVAAMPAVRVKAADQGLYILAIGLCVLAALVLFEGFSGQTIYLAFRDMVHQATRPDLARRNVARACYPLALLIWPVALYLWRRGGGARAGALLLGAMTLASAIILQVDAPILALVLGALTVLAVRLGGRLMFTAAIAVTVVYFIMTPVLVSEFVHPQAAQVAGSVAKASWGIRVSIWRYVSLLIEQRPFLGWGLDASRMFPGAIPLHPHNGALQIWLELGAVGAALTATFFAWLFVRIESIWRYDPALGSCAAGSTVAYLVIGALSFGIWQEWWLALGGVTVAVITCLAIVRRDPPATALAAFASLANPPLGNSPPTQSPDTLPVISPLTGF
jgi:O-antigen ligase